MILGLMSMCWRNRKNELKEKERLKSVGKRPVINIVHRGWNISGSIATIVNFGLVNFGG
jgi:hypothetical protein